jgi:[ribosomal protein S5]-alanine N-acetyltransferase
MPSARREDSLQRLVEQGLLAGECQVGEANLADVQQRAVGDTVAERTREPGRVLRRAVLRQQARLFIGRKVTDDRLRIRRLIVIPGQCCHRLTVPRLGLAGQCVESGNMLDSLRLPPLPTLQGERVTLRGPRDSDVDDRLRHPIDPEEEDGYGSSWRREWDGRRYHTREYLTAAKSPPDPRTYTWMVEYDGHSIGSAGLKVNPDQHLAEYTVGLFVAALRGRGLGREVTRLVLAWAFDVLGVHRVELQAVAGNSRAINCYLACGFRQEGVRREAELYPDGWKDFIMMGILRSEHAGT